MEAHACQNMVVVETLTFENIEISQQIVLRLMYFTRRRKA